MKKNIFVLSLLVVARVSQAQPVTVESLFEASSRMPTVLIPFTVGGEALSDGGEVVETSVNASAGADCRMMRDPYLSNIYLLKCSSEAVVHLNWTVVHGEKTYRVSYGPVEVEKPEEGMEIVPPRPTEPADPKILAGRQLFNAYCITCHTQPAGKAGRSRAQMKSAVDTVPSMAGLKTILQDADYEKLEAYLKTL